MVSPITFILLFLVAWSIIIQYIIVIKMFFNDEWNTKKEFLGSLIPLVPQIILLVGIIIELIDDGKKAWKKLK